MPYRTIGHLDRSDRFPRLCWQAIASRAGAPAARQSAWRTRAGQGL